MMEETTASVTASVEELLQTNIDILRNINVQLLQQQQYAEQIIVILLFLIGVCSALLVLVLLYKAIKKFI